MSDPVLTAGQYSIDGLVYGEGTNIRISQTSIDLGTLVKQDVQLVNNDGRIMGIDFFPGMAITQTGQSLNPGDPISTLNSFETLHAAWFNENIRWKPGAYSVLRMNYPGSSATRRVYGRGRALTPTLGMVKRGWIGFVSQFDAVDSNFYSDSVSSVVLGTAPATSGITPPLTPSVVVQKTFSSTNLISAADADFELPWTGNWSAVSLISTLNRSQTFANTGQWSMISSITGAGTAKFELAPVAVIASQTYGLSVAFEADGTTSGGTATVSAQWMNSSFGNIGGLVTFGTKTGSTSAQTISGILTAPAGAAYLQIVVTYAASAAGNVYWDTWILVQSTNLVAPAIQNFGTIPTWPTFTITGPCTNPQITFPSSGAYVLVATTLNAFQRVTISTAPWNRYVAGSSAVVGGGALRFASIDPFIAPGNLGSSAQMGNLRGSSLDDMILAPGLTYVSYTAQDATGGSTCTVTWRDAFRAIGGSVS